MKKRSSVLRDPLLIAFAALLLSFPGGAMATASGWVNLLVATLWGSIPTLLVVVVGMKFLVLPDGLGIKYELHYNRSPIPGALALGAGVLAALVALILASASLTGLIPTPPQQFRVLFLGGYIVVVGATVFLLIGVQETVRELSLPEHRPDGPPATET